jgi:hypothetical protein
MGSLVVVNSSVLGAQPVPQPNASQDATPDQIRVLDALTFGPTEADFEKLRDVGLARWLDGQLHPAPNDALRHSKRISNQ